ncbi:MAG TPA: substrate-binding domain-containing protein [Herpetosiphonaceae bacterium]
MRNLTCVLLLLIGLLLAGGPAGSPAAAAPAGPRIAWLANDPANTYDLAIYEGARAVVGRAGGTVAPFYAGFDPAVQLAQCRAAIAAGAFDALVVIAASPTEILPCVSEARAAGLPVGAADLVIGEDQATVRPQAPGQVAASFIPASRFGDGVAAILPELCAGLASCEVLYVAGVASFPIDAYGLAAVKAAGGGVRLAAQAEAFYDTETARQAVAAALAAHPEINVVIASGDQMALGAEQAARELGVGLRIVGAGAGASALEAVRSGRWFATFNALPRSEGFLVATLLLRALDGPAPPVGIDPVAGSGLPAWWTRSTLAAHPGFKGQWPGP